MKHLAILFSFSFFYFFIGCNKSEVNTIEDNTLIIGLTFGECVGDCAYFIKIEGNQVYLDNEDGYFTTANTPSFKNENILTNAIVNEMENLRTSFPDFLIQSNETSFGCPDCGDWGALPLFREVDGALRFWILDNDNQSNPEEIQAWVESMQILINDTFF